MIMIFYGISKCIIMAIMIDTDIDIYLWLSFFFLEKDKWNIIKGKETNYKAKQKPNSRKIRLENNIHVLG